MYTYFSRFLHHTPSLSDLIGKSRSNKFASLFNLDYRVKPDNDRMGKDASLKPDGDRMGKDAPLKPDGDSLCAGRSMVEMLGVLAIIGVLSVGAIAGYSKAMMKYKLNQHAQAVNMLINNVLQLKGQLQFTPDDYTYYGTLLYKMNLLPDGINYVSNVTLQDSWFKSRISVFYNNLIDGNGVRNDFGSIAFIFPKASFGAEICRNIVIAAKENAANLYELLTQKCNDDSSCDYYGRAHGDSYCGNDKKCINSLTLNDISELCNICDDQNCSLILLWK